VSTRSAEAFDAEQFRLEVRTFCRREFPSDLAEKASTHAYFSKDDRVRWQRILQRRGWFAGHWPREHGGAGWGARQRFIFIEELERAGTPWLTHFGVSFAGPVLYTFGTEAQKARFLPGILQSECWWCQGFSEPGAGSDLAAVRTRATLRDGEYVVSGHKTWATMAHWADMMFALVRTSDRERPHQGLSLLLIDMHSPGVTVRPIATIDGGHHINDVFFDDVRVPVDNRVGEEGDGWRCVKLIVGQERPLVTELGKARRMLNLLRELVTSGSKRHMPVRTAGRRIRYRLAELGVQLAALEALAYATFSETEGLVSDEVGASMLKIRGSEMQQALFDALVDVLGIESVPFEPDTISGSVSAAFPGSEPVSRLLFEHLHSRATSIYGGSNEIQLHIIARALLGS